MWPWFTSHLLVMNVRDIRKAGYTRLDPRGYITCARLANRFEAANNSLDLDLELLSYLFISSETLVYTSPL